MEVTTTSTVQIIMANKPRMLREMLSKIFNRSKQVNVIGEVTRMSQLPLLVELLHPDWVVLTLCNDGSFPGTADAVVHLNPEVGILAVTENGETARARYGGMVFDGMTLDELVDLICRRVSTNRSNPIPS